MGLFSKKVGGFKLALERKKSYHYEVAAVGLSLILLSAIVLSLNFASRLLTNLFSESIGGQQSEIKFNLEQAKEINKVKLYLENMGVFESAVLEPTPGLTPVPSLSPSLQPTKR